MARPAPPPRPAATLAFRLRVESLDARCVPSVAAVEWPPPAGGGALAVLSAAPEPGRLYGPLVTVPQATAAGRDAVIDWADGVVTPGVLIPRGPDLTEVWGERVLAAGTSYKVTVTLFNTADPDDNPVVYLATYTTGPVTAGGRGLGVGLETPGSSQSPPLPHGGTPTPPPIVPPAPPAPPTPPSPGPAETPPAPPPPAPPAPPPPVPPPAPPPGPPAPTAAPAAPFAARPPLPPPRSESPFRAGEVRVLAKLSDAEPPAASAHRPDPAPVTLGGGSLYGVRGGVPAAAAHFGTKSVPAMGGIPGLRTATGLTPAVDGSLFVGRLTGQPERFWASAQAARSDAASAGSSAPRVVAGAGGPGPAATFLVSADLQAWPGTAPASDEPAARPQDPGGSAQTSRELLAALATAPAPDAVFLARPADDPPQTRESPFLRWARRAVVLLAAAGVGYRAWAPRSDRPVAQDDGSPFRPPEPL